LNPVIKGRADVEKGCGFDWGRLPPWGVNSK
jgi:hypothetical protein